MRRAVRAIIIKNDSLLVMKRNKFGKQYYTLVGGGVDGGESLEESLYREIQEETGIKVANPRLVFVEEPGEPYGTQYVYLCEYRSGEPALHLSSIEHSLNKDGRNTYQPTWVPLVDLEKIEFLSNNLKKAILDSVQNGFPKKPKKLV